jgi:hypothetical protein
MYWHALPQAWETMTYQEFLETRRRLMGVVTREPLHFCENMDMSPSIQK